MSLLSDGESYSITLTNNSGVLYKERLTNNSVQIGDTLMFQVTGTALKDSIMSNAAQRNALRGRTEIVAKAVALGGSSGGTASYPSFTGNAGKVLVVNATEDGVEWVTLPSGGGENIPDSDFTKVTYIKTDTSNPMWVEAEYTPENINGELHIDWGDGAKEVLNIADFEAIIYLEHEYAVNGEYVVKAYSTTQASYTCFGEITKVIDWGSPANLQPRFSSDNLIEVPSTLHPALTNLQYMFSNCYSFNQDISNWDVSNVTNMKQMFYNNYTFNQPIGNWNTSNVTDMYSMFRGCSSFNQDISTWDVSNVTNMYGMFWEATSFNQPLNNWNTSNVNYMAAMFYNATSFNQDIGSWDVSQVIDMYTMFSGASAFNQDLSQWCVSEIASLPYEFDLNAIDWTLPRPVWGTCPAP